MGLLDDALEIQDGKRSRRLSQSARKAKIDSHKIKEGTYRGMDLTDGTARVQLDDQPTTTSGYRLITNAPLGNGDRVSIRPNGVGLPRADARNVAPKVEDIVAAEFLPFTAFFAFSNGVSVDEEDKFFGVDVSVANLYNGIETKFIESFYAISSNPETSFTIISEKFSSTQKGQSCSILLSIPTPIDPTFKTLGTALRIGVNKKSKDLYRKILSKINGENSLTLDSRNCPIDFLESSINSINIPIPRSTPILIIDSPDFITIAIDTIRLESSIAPIEYLFKSRWKFKV